MNTSDASMSEPAADSPAVAEAAPFPEPRGTPEAQTPLPSDAPNLEMSRYVARLLDMSVPVPGTKFHLGADSIIGLVPVVGDLVTGAAGCVILADAARHKVPPEIMGKMIVNLGVDVAGGAVMPGIGDVFDLFWKANKKNLTLMEDHFGLERTFKKGGEETKETEALKLKWNPAAAASAAGGRGNGMAKAIFSGLAGTDDGGSVTSKGGTRIKIVRSKVNPKLEYLVYSFVVENMGRRSETNVYGGGGGGMVYGSGGNVYGATAPVTIRSSTTHKSELWFTDENGREDWVWINLDTLMVRDGQQVSLIFARRNRNRGAFLAARNHSTGKQEDMEKNGYQRSAMNGFPLVTAVLVAIGLLIGLAGAETSDGLSLVLPAIAVAPYLFRMMARTGRLREEVRRLLED